MSALVSERIEYFSHAFIKELPPVEIAALQRIIRPTGYSIPGVENIYIKAKSGKFESEGWGAGPAAIAEAKAFSEAIERLALKITAGGSWKSKTSNGWAAHLNEKSARIAAVSELVERDVTLSTWLNGGPFFSIPENLWPEQIRIWAQSSRGKAEFYQPLPLLSSSANGSAVTVLLLNEENGCVSGHASGLDFSSSILSAFFEALRMAHSTLRFNYFGEVALLHYRNSKVNFQPGANALAYAYGEALPPIEIQSTSEDEIKAHWAQHINRLTALFEKEAAFATYHSTGRFIVQAKLPALKNIFWGPTPDHWNVKNKRPHIVG